MREIRPESFPVFYLDELSPQAQEKAVERVRSLWAGPWWNSGCDEEIRNDMMYALGRAIGAPGVENYGEGDYPGVDGVTVAGWDLERGGFVQLRGVLTRQNAPSLPWADGLVRVELRTTSRNWSATDADVVWNENARDPHSERDLTVVREECKKLAEALGVAVEAAIDQVVISGRATLDHLLSAEFAREDIETNMREFREDGTLFV